jgi:hypothetical protein
MYSETHIDNIDNNEKRAQLMKIGHPRLKTGATQRPTLVTKSFNVIVPSEIFLTSIR